MVYRRHGQFLIMIFFSFLHPTCSDLIGISSPRGRSGSIFLFNDREASGHGFSSRMNASVSRVVMVACRFIWLSSLHLGLRIPAIYPFRQIRLHGGFRVAQPDFGEAMDRGIDSYARIGLSGVTSPS
ncbi:hypothetical protein F4777DRAFT_567758 [Nemania sp. FL0916]|nr:hypothetical protein F4777DRAFT_567758 [Nemania sp. FL0916]